MFLVQSAHHQVNDANCTYAASGIITLCKWLSCVTDKKKGGYSVERRSLTAHERYEGCHPCDLFPLPHYRHQF